MDNNQRRKETCGESKIKLDVREDSCMEFVKRKQSIFRQR